MICDLLPSEGFAGPELNDPLPATASTPLHVRCGSPDRCGTSVRAFPPRDALGQRTDWRSVRGKFPKYHHHQTRLRAVGPNARLGVSTVMAAVDKIAVASDHNILAHSNKSDARGLATLAAVRRQWRPQVPIRSITTDVRSFYEGRAVVNDACGNDGG